MQARNFNKSNNIITSTVALGSDVNATVFQEVASVGKGRYYTLKNSSEIVPLYDELLNQIKLRKNVSEVFDPKLTNEELSEIKAKLVKLGYKDADANYDGAVDRFLNDYYYGKCSLKANYDNLTEIEKFCSLPNWIDKALLGSITKGSDNASLNFLDETYLVPRYFPDGTEITDDNKYDKNDYLKNYYRDYIYEKEKLVRGIEGSPFDGMFIDWAKDTYGLDSMERFAHMVDLTPLKIPLGCWDALVSAVNGLGYMVTHGKETAEGIDFLMRAMHPLENPDEYNVLCSLISVSMKQCYKDFSEADDEKRAKMMGRLIGEIIVAVAGGKGVIKPIQIFKNTALFSELLSKVANKIITSEEMIRILIATNEALEKIKTVIATKIDDLLIYVNKITKLDDCYEMVTPEGIVVRIDKSEISTANTTKIDEMIAKVTAEAIEATGKIIKSGLDDYYKALMGKEIKIIDPSTGALYKSNKIAAALDTKATEVDNINIGFNGAMSKYNPSADVDFSVSMPEDIAKLNKKVKIDYLVKLYTKNSLETLYENKFIDDLFANYGDYYKSKGVIKEEVIEQMDKFRSMLKKANEYAKSNGRAILDINGNIVGYTMTGWRVENCAEVWAVRNAILGGAKVDNIVLRTILWDNGKFEILCDQCKIAFSDFIKSGRIISD